MARTVDPNIASQNWGQAMNNGVTQDKYKRGVQRQTQSPTAKAATDDAQQRYISGVQQSVSSGRRATALMAVDLASWQKAAIDKGVARIGPGATASIPKMQKFFAKWAPIYSNVSSTIEQMPKGGLANAIARSTKAIQMMMDAAGKS